MSSEQRALEAERDRLALVTRKGIGMPLAGLIYWLAVAVILRQMPQRAGLIVCFFATGAVFPLGALLTRVAGGDLFAKSATLTPLGLQLAAVQLFYWPIIVVIFQQAPAWTPFAMAVLFGSHFLPYWWLYRSRAYALLAVLTTVSSAVAALIAGGPLFTAIPLIAATCYALACVALGREVASLTRQGPNKRLLQLKRETVRRRHHLLMTKLLRTISQLLVVGFTAAAIACRTEIPPGAPLLRLVATDSGYEAASSVSAGPVRVRLVNATDGWHEALLVRFEDSASVATYLEAVRAGQDSPAGAIDLGGPGIVAAADSSEVLVSLGPGRYAVVCWTADHVKAGAIVPFTVTEPSRRVVDSLLADGSISLKDFAYALSAPMRTGAQVLRVVNQGTRG